MMRNKIKNKKISYCIGTLILTMLLGCSVNTKKKSILSLQKRRIQKLEKQLSRKNKQIDRLKAIKWSQASKRQKPKESLRPLRNLVKKQKWTQALQESARLKKIYPKSIALRTIRLNIFEKMGLKKQASKEIKILRHLVRSQGAKKRRVQ